MSFNKKIISFIVVSLILSLVYISTFVSAVEKDQQLLDLINSYRENGQPVDLEEILAKTDDMDIEDIEIVGFTNLEKGPIDLETEIFSFDYFPGNHLLLYNIKSGDSLYRIAREFNTTVDRLKEENNLDSDQIFAGDKLYIPVPDFSSPDLPDDEGLKIVYYVERGDSLYQISREYGISISAIRSINDLDGDMIYIGQRLYIPLSEPGQPDIPEQRSANLLLSYTVEQGETLQRIANKFNLSAQDIREANNLHSDHLTPGREILLPFSVDSKLQELDMDLTEEEEKLMARVVYSEARGEPFKGQVAVAAVVFNRVESSQFPNTIREVIFQPWQFTAVHDGQFWLEPVQQSHVAYLAALKGWDPSRGAIFYYNPRTAESEWIFYRHVVVKIGQHYFAV